MKRVRVGEQLEINCRLNDPPDGVDWSADVYKFEKVLFYGYETDLVETNEAEINTNASDETTTATTRRIKSEDGVEVVVSQRGETFNVFESRELLDKHLARVQLGSGLEQRQPPVEYRRIAFRLQRGAVYADSGRYFCVFGSQSTGKYLVSSLRIAVFDGKQTLDK